MSYKAYSGTGTVYIAPVNSSGVLTGNWTNVGDAYPLSLQVSTKKTEVKSRQVERAGQVIASKVDLDKMEGKLTLREWNATNLAMALSGSATSMSAAGGTVVDEAMVMPKPGEYKKVAHPIDLTSVTVTSSPAGTTYVKGTDYTYDAKLGLFTSIAGGALAAGTVATLIDYTYGAETDYQVDIGSKTQMRVAMRVHLFDEYRSDDYVMELDSVVMSSNSDINFISEEGSTGELLQFDLSLETLSGKTSPGRINGVPI